METSTNSKFNLAYATLLIAYFTACGGLWHIGYWTTFDINILQYLTLSDIIKSYIIPFITSSVYFFATYLYTAFIIYSTKIKNPGEHSFGKGANTKLGIMFNKYLSIILMLDFLLIVILLVWGPDYKWIFVAVLISAPISVRLTNTNLMTNIFANPDIRVSIFNFLIALPILSFGFAKWTSYKVFKNKNYEIISKLESNSLKNTNQLIGLKYLGTVGDVYFLSTVDNSEIIFLNNRNVDFISFIKANK
jgi:hypothetical protein